MHSFPRIDGLAFEKYCRATVGNVSDIGAEAERAVGAIATMAKTIADVIGINGLRPRVIPALGRGAMFHASIAP